MPDIFSQQFWKSQWDAVMVAPWLIIPLLLLAGYVGSRWRHSVDDGEIRGLRAELAARDAQLELARDQEKSVIAQLAETKIRLAELERKISASESPEAIRAAAAEALASVGRTSAASDLLGATLGISDGAYKPVPFEKITRPSE